jgi:uncharacterized protein
MNLAIQHDLENQEFTADVDGQQAELAYATPEPNVLNFTHTFVPPGARNQGVAVNLIEAGMQYAEQEGFKVTASCPVVEKFLRTNENYQHLRL